MILYNLSPPQYSIFLSKRRETLLHSPLTKVIGTVVIGLFAYVGSASAIEVTPVDAMTTSEVNTSYTVANLINNSGLSGGLHDDNPRNVWSSKFGETTPSLTFDLGGVYDLTGTNIWQGNERNNLNDGVKRFNISTSFDGDTYTTIGTNYTLTQSPGGFISSQFISFLSNNTRYVKFDVLENYGGNYTGLSEVKFKASAGGPTAVPEPLTILGSLTAFGIGSAFKNKLKLTKLD